MGIQVQGCGLVLLLVLLFFFVRQKRVGLYTERIFFITLMIAIGCLSLDIFTIYAIKARAYIPILAGNDFHIKAQRKIPHTKVTGPRTKRFSSLFLAAASVIVEMTGTWIPLSLMNSETEYKVKRTRRTIMVAG